MTDEMFRSPYEKGQEECLLIKNRLCKAMEEPVEYWEDIKKCNKRELDAYEKCVRMNSDERDALRRWVSSGHSVYENPGSRYMCLCGAYPPPDFLDVYRMDRELNNALKGKSDPEKKAYLQDYFGWDDDIPTESEEQKEIRTAYGQTPLVVLNRIRKLKRELFYLWMFLSAEGLSEDARTYVEDNIGTEVPFEEEW